MSNALTTGFGVLSILLIIMNGGVLGEILSIHPVAAAISSNAPFNYIVSIMMENRNYADVIGSPSAPYLSQLASNYGLATNFHNVSPYGSLPNYLGPVAGQTYDSSWSRCNSPPSACTGWPSGGVTDPTVVNRIEGAGLTWKAYMENMPTDCYSQDALPYMAIHNPFIYFSHISNNASECARVVPAGTGDSTLLSDLRSTSTSSNYMWLTPNNCNDMWGCSTSTGDTYLSNLVPKILSSSVFQTQKAALFITWDEGSTSGHVPGIWAGPVVKRGYSSGVNYSHYSILKTIETAWGLSSLTSNDGSASAMTEFFTTINTIQPSFTFTPINPLVAQNVTFTGAATGGTSPYTFVWDFGDGAIGSGNPIRHEYFNQGSYTVTLSAKDSTGLTGGISQTVNVSGPPDYSISLNPASLIVDMGGSGTSTVVLKSLNGFAGSINLGASVSPSGLVLSFSSTSVILSSGSTATSILTIQAPSTVAPGNYTVTVTSTNGTISHSAILAVTAKAIPDFGLLTDPVSLATLQGGTVSSVITVTSLNRFSGSVSLSASVSAGGFVVQLNPNNPNVSPGGSSTSTLTVTSPSNAIPETYLITLKGQSGSMTHAVTLPLAVTSFGLDISPGSISVPPGSTGTLSITLASINGFSGNITLSGHVSNKKLTATIGSQLITVPAGGTASTTLTVGSSAQGGYTVTVTASTGKLTRNLQVGVSVTTQPDFFLSASPIFIVIPEGSSGNSTITVTSVNGLSGNVNLHLAVNPGGPVVSLNPLSLRLVSGGSASSTLTISVPSSVQPGIYSITVTGSDGPNHPIILTLFVTRPVPDFTLSATPNSQTVAAGGSASYSISLASLDGFSGNVTLTTSSQYGLDSSLNPSFVVLSPGGRASSTLTITTASATVPATYVVSFTATSGTLTHSASLSLVVTSPPDFTLTPSPQSQTMLAGNVAATSISLNNLNGFSGGVSLTATVSPTIGLNCTLNPTTIGGSQTSTLSCRGSANNYTVAVSGTSGTLSRSTNVTFTIQDFTISASPEAVNLTAGGQGSSTITIASLQGFNRVVSLTSSPSSTFVSASLNPTSVTGSGGSTLTVSGSIPGRYTVNVTGTSNPLSHGVIVKVNVNSIQDFTMSASPTSVTDDAYSLAVSNITVTAVNGFTGTVALSQNGGASCSLSSSSVSLTAASTSGSVALGCTFTAAGNDNVTVTGNSGTISHSTTVDFTVQDFTINANPTSISSTVSQAGTSNITVTALQGFTGVVNLATNSTSCTVAPNGVTGSGSATLSCTFSSVGMVHVIVSGTSGSLSHSVTVTYSVSPLASFSLSASPTGVTILAGATGTSTINVTASGGFAGTVSLTAIVSPSTGLTCSLSPSSVALSSTTTSGSSALSCGGSQGLYTVTVTGTSGTSQASTQVTFTVQDFAITGNPLSVGFSPGGTGSSTINIAGLQGFNGVVNLTASVSSPSITANLNQTMVTGSGKSTLTASGSTTGTYSVTITGTSNSLSHSVTITVNVGGPQDFQISTSPASIILYPGGTNASIVSITPMNGFTGSVSLSATVPSDFSALFSNNPAAAGSTSTLSVSAASNVAVGSYTVTINGTSGSLTHSVSLSVRVLAKPAIAFVADVPVAGSSSNTATTSAMTFTKGDLIVVYVTVGAGQTVSFITDSGSPSSTYTQRASAVNGNNILYLYTATAATSTNNTITVTVSAGGYLAISAAEYSGVVGFGALNTSTGTSTTPTVSLTTRNANSWVLVTYGWTGSGTHSANTGFNDRHAGSYGTQHLDYGDTSAAKPAGTYTYSGTLSQSDPWAMIALELV